MPLIVTDSFGKIVVDDSPSPSTSQLTWRDDMSELFDDLENESEYKTTLTYNGQIVTGIKIPVSMRYQMQLNGYDFSVTTTFDMRKSDCAAIGLYAAARATGNNPKRPLVTVQGKSFHVMEIKDDDESDPTVKLMLSPVQ